MIALRVRLEQRGTLLKRVDFYCFWIISTSLFSTFLHFSPLHIISCKRMNQQQIQPKFAPCASRNLATLVVVMVMVYVYRGGGWTEGPNVPALSSLNSRLFPPFSWLPPFSPFSFAKDKALLCNFLLFLPLLALLEQTPPAISCLTSPTRALPPPAPFVPSSYPFFVSSSI